MALAVSGRVRGELTRRGYTVAPSRGNFLFFDCGGDAPAFGERLLVQGVVTKPWSQAGFGTFVRVSIGRPAESDHILARSLAGARLPHGGSSARGGWREASDDGVPLGRVGQPHEGHCALPAPGAALDDQARRPLGTPRCPAMAGSAPTA